MIKPFVKSLKYSGKCGLNVFEYCFAFDNTGIGSKSHVLNAQNATVHTITSQDFLNVSTGGEAHLYNNGMNLTIHTSTERHRTVLPLQSAMSTARGELWDENHNNQNQCLIFAKLFESYLRCIHEKYLFDNDNNSGVSSDDISGDGNQNPIVGDNLLKKQIIYDENGMLTKLFSSTNGFYLFDVNNKTPFDYAIEYGYTNMISFYCNFIINDTSLVTWIDNTYVMYKYAILLIKSRYTKPESLRRLLQTGKVDVNMQPTGVVENASMDDDPEMEPTLIEFALYQRYHGNSGGDNSNYMQYLLHCVEILGEFGCDFRKLNRQKDKYKNALHMCVAHNDYKCLKSIIQCCVKRIKNDRRHVSFVTYDNDDDSDNDNDDSDNDDDNDSDSDDGDNDDGGDDSDDKHDMKVRDLFGSIVNNDAEEDDDDEDSHTENKEDNKEESNDHDKMKKTAKSKPETAKSILREMLHVNEYELLNYAAAHEYWLVMKTLLECTEFELKSPHFHSFVENIFLQHFKSQNSAFHAVKRDVYSTELIYQLLHNPRAMFLTRCDVQQVTAMKLYYSLMYDFVYNEMIKHPEWFADKFASTNNQNDNNNSNTKNIDEDDDSEDDDDESAGQHKEWERDQLPKHRKTLAIKPGGDAVNELDALLGEGNLGPEAHAIFESSMLAIHSSDDEQEATKSQGYVYEPDKKPNFPYPSLDMLDDCLSILCDYLGVEPTHGKKGLNDVNYNWNDIYKIETMSKALSCNHLIFIKTVKKAAFGKINAVDIRNGEDLSNNYVTYVSQDGRFYFMKYSVEHLDSNDRFGTGGSGGSSINFRYSASGGSSYNHAVARHSASKSMSKSRLKFKSKSTILSKLRLDALGTTGGSSATGSKRNLSFQHDNNNNNNNDNDIIIEQNRIFKIASDFAIPLQTSWSVTCCIDPTGTYAAHGSIDNIIEIYDVSDKISIAHEPHQLIQQESSSMGFPNAFLSHAPSINNTSSCGFEKVAEMEVHEAYVSKIEFIDTIDGSYLVSTSGDSSAVLYNVEDNFFEKRFVAPKKDIKDFAFIKLDSNLLDHTNSDDASNDDNNGDNNHDDHKKNDGGNEEDWHAFENDILFLFVSADGFVYFSLLSEFEECIGKSELSVNEELNCIDIASNEKYFVVGDSDGFVKIFEIDYKLILDKNRIDTCKKVKSNMLETKYELDTNWREFFNPLNQGTIQQRFGHLMKLHNRSNSTNSSNNNNNNNNNSELDDKNNNFGFNASYMEHRKMIEIELCWIEEMILHPKLLFQTKGNSKQQSLHDLKTKNAFVNRRNPNNNGSNGSNGKKSNYPFRITSARFVNDSTIVWVDGVGNHIHWAQYMDGICIENNVSYDKEKGKDTIANIKQRTKEREKEKEKEKQSQRPISARFASFQVGFGGDKTDNGDNTRKGHNNNNNNDDGDEDGECIWNQGTFQDTHKGTIACLSVDKHENIVVSSGYDSNIVFYDVNYLVSR